MRAHLAYLRYVLRHKWYVFIASRRLGVSWWRMIKHDWHKFLPSEWGPYVRTFYAPDGSKRYVESVEFANAWRLHQQRGDHHWQHWLLTWDRGVTEPMEMPLEAVREMVADWSGAGKAITGKWGANEWFQKNAEKMKLHISTGTSVHAILYHAEANNLFPNE